MATAGRTAAERTMGLIIWALAFGIFETRPAVPGPAARSEQPGGAGTTACSTTEQPGDDARTEVAAP